MKKAITVVGVISSAHEDSNSAAMVREALKGAAEAGAAVREIYLPDYSLEFCTGCAHCMRAGRCRFDDDFAGIRAALIAADGIIWGSPTYGGAPNAIMKNLIDRLGLYEIATSSLGGRYMAGIASANAAGAAKKVAKGLACFGVAGTFMRSYASGWLGAGFRGGKKASEDGAVLHKARRLGAKVVEDIRSGRKYPLQGALVRLMSGLVMKPLFAKYISEHRDGDTRIVYADLKARGLIP